MKDNNGRSATKRIVAWAIVGAIPGVIALLLTLPVSGELELTLGVGGIFLAILGIIVGAIIGARKR